MPLSSQLKESDTLQSQSKVDENYSLLQRLYDAGDRSGDFLWRYARANYDLAQNTTDKSKMEQLITTGLEAASQARQKVPDDFAAHKWYGILLSSKGDFVPTKEKIGNAYTIRDSFLKAIELNNRDSTSYYSLGKWNCAIAGVSWVERQAAALLFDTPPQATFEDCEKYLKAANDIDPGELHVQLALGDVDVQLKKKAEAKGWYEAAAKFNAITEKQKKDRAEAEAKAKKL